MASSLNISLTDELRRFVDSRAGDHGCYATPSEYLRDLIRKDMSEQALVSQVLAGIADIEQSRFSDKSIMDIAKDS